MLPDGNSKRVLGNVDSSASKTHVAVDSTREGLWLLQESEDDEGKSILTHVDESGDTEIQEIFADFGYAPTMVDAGPDKKGVYLHYNVGNKWKLCLAMLGTAELENACDCARDSHIMSCGLGGVWIWKKAGRRAENLSLNYYSAEKGTIYGCANRFPHSSVIVGETAKEK
jgi:hypothetical protein